jgi:starvation-inducible DNA-binding protein
MHATRNDLSISAREKMIAMLDSHLADGVDLFTQVKQAYWNVKGPHCGALHQLFGESASLVERQCNQIAARIVALGGRADGTVRCVAARSTLPEFDFDTDEGLVYTAQVAERLSLFGKALRIGIGRASACDLVTAALLTEMTGQMDNQLASLEAVLQAEH